VGSTVVVSSETESVLEGIADGNNGGNVDNVIRLSGATRFETSAAIAEWEVDGEGFTWDKAAFARGDLAFDALAGSVLQGRGNSVLLLIDDSDRVTADTLGSNASAVAEVRFFGSRAAVSTSTRNYVLSRLGANIEYRNFNVSLSELARIESQLPYSGDYGYQAYYDILDPDNADYMFGNSEFYQFAVLNEYTDDVTAAQLNAYIANQVAYNEGRYGVTSVLRGQGQAFIDAARRWNVNVVYLLSHAAYESAWGCSSFAQGTVTGYGGYYNLFGIRCFNSNPSVGAQYAKDRGWDTVSKAIDGGAQWISNGIQLSNGVDGGYLNRYGQNTLYLMKWDLFNMEDSNDPWHQYCTGLSWQSDIANIMGRAYNRMGVNPNLRYSVPILLP
jgi:beta-N-acetylglucosaminidase